MLQIASSYRGLVYGFGMLTKIYLEERTATTLILRVVTTYYLPQTRYTFTLKGGPSDLGTKTLQKY